jgi:hypothetical protein
MLRAMKRKKAYPGEMPPRQLMSEVEGVSDQAPSPEIAAAAPEIAAPENAPDLTAKQEFMQAKAKMKRSGKNRMIQRRNNSKGGAFMANLMKALSRQQGMFRL